MVVLRWPVAREMQDERLILRVGEDVPIVAKQESKESFKAGTLKFGVKQVDADQISTVER